MNLCFVDQAVRDGPGVALPEPPGLPRQDSTEPGQLRQPGHGSIPQVSYVITVLPQFLAACLIAGRYIYANRPAQEEKNCAKCQNLLVQCALGKAFIPIKMVASLFFCTF